MTLMRITKLKNRDILTCWYNCSNDNYNKLTNTLYKGPVSMNWIYFSYVRYLFIKSETSISLQNVLPP